MSTNFSVNSFLGMLKQNQPQPRDFSAASKDRKLEKVYLSFPDNYGKYQLFPMTSTVTGNPFVSLPKTREIKIPRRNVLPDGTENEFHPWIKILPNEAYVMVDSTGRLVSSLTAEDENLLTQARNLFDQLYDLMGGNNKEGNNDPNINKTIGFMRRRNYTLFHGKCLNKWGMKDPRTPERSNFAALFVCSASGFFQAIDENVSDERISHGGSDEWLTQVYNRDLTGRSGYLIFSIALGVGGKVGYQITATHKSDVAAYLKDEVITEEEASLMQDPVADFLGWQANYGDPVHLFNKNLMIETINFLSQQIAAVRLALSSGANVKDAVDATSNMILQAQKGSSAVSTDPVLAQQGTPDMAQKIYSENVDPYHTAPAAQIDPISQTPINPAAQTPYVQPSFARQTPNPTGNPFLN